MAGTWRYRPRSNTIFAILTGLVVLLVLWSGVQNTTVGLLRAAAWALVLGTAGWVAFVRPMIQVDDDGVTLVNPLRTVVVPWAALIAVHTQFALTLRTPNGKYAAWAAPGPSRYAVRESTSSDVRAVARKGEAVALGDLPGAPSGLAARQVRTRWAALSESGELALGEADQTPVQISVAWGLGALLLASLVAAILLTVVG